MVWTKVGREIKHALVDSGAQKSAINIDIIHALNKDNPDNPAKIDNHDHDLRGISGEKINILGNTFDYLALVLLIMYNARKKYMKHL